MYNSDNNIWHEKKAENDNKIYIVKADFLANDPFIRELQTELISQGYFLERLANEYSYKLKLGKINEYERTKVLILENVIQIYASFYIDEYAARAKRGKNELFNKGFIGKIVESINADRVINSYNWYLKIPKILTLYRKCRRSDTNNDIFLNYLDIKYPDNEE